LGHFVDQIEGIDEAYTEISRWRGAKPGRQCDSAQLGMIPKVPQGTPESVVPLAVSLTNYKFGGF
jgi:hypothetical protein